MAKSSSSSNAPMWVVVALLAIVVLGGGYYLFSQGGGEQTAADKEAVVTGEKAVEGVFGTNAIPSATVEFNAKARASDAQDDESDLDIDVLEWDDSRNDDLADKHYVDCSGAVPAFFNGKDTFVDVTDANRCDVNRFKFWQSFTAADTESKLGEELVKTASDLDDVDGSGTKTVVLKTDKTYLVSLVEGADTDEEDVIPQVFLIKLAPKTTFDADEVAAGNVKIRFNTEYFSDAAAHSKLRIGGQCEDDEENNPQLTSGLDGFVDSSLTTQTTISADCDIEVEVTKEGYALHLTNPLANSQAERAYIQIEPYGTNSTGGWVEYGSNSLTGDIGYSASASNSSIIWQGMDACGAVLTDSSSTDAVKLGGEKLYEGTPGYDCFKDLYHTGGSNPKMVIPLHISEVAVDYDASTDGDSGALEANSGSSPEAIADINAVGLESTSDFIAQVLNA